MDDYNSENRPMGNIQSVFLASILAPAILILSLGLGARLAFRAIELRLFYHGDDDLREKEERRLF